MSAVEFTLAGLHDEIFRRVPLPAKRDASILDLGCGAGAWLSRLERAGYSNLLGVDVSARPYGTAYASGAQHHIADLDASDIGLGDRRFDVIFAIEVIEHLEAPGFLLRHIARHLAPGGFAFLTTPNIHSLVSRLRYTLTGRLGQFDAKSDPTHVAPILLDGLERMCARRGELRIEKAWGYPDDGSSMIYRRPLVALSQVLERVGVPNRVRGDTLCVLFRRAAE